MRIATLSISLTAALSANNIKIGEGIRTSAEYIVAKNRMRLAKANAKIEIVAVDDFDSGAHLAKAHDRAAANGDLAMIIGSNSAITEDVIGNRQLSGLPVLCTFATSSVLSNLGYRHFYRFQSKDADRVEALIATCMERTDILHTGCTLFVLRGAPESYGSRLRDDAIAVLERERISVTLLAFSINALPPRPAKSGPIIVCAPSAETVMLIRHLRSQGVSSQFYAFGSNSNFLRKECLDLMVVTDVSPDDENVKKRALLRDYSRTYPAQTEPSISTMIAMETIINFVIDRRDALGDNDSNRKAFLAYLDGVPKGPFGSLGFDDNGEMIGRDYATCMVRRGANGKYVFGPRLATSRFRVLGWVIRQTVDRTVFHGWRAVGVVSTAGGAVSAVLWLTGVL